MIKIKHAIKTQTSNTCVMWPDLHWKGLLLSHSVVSDSLWPHGLQHTRFPCHFTISRSLLKLMFVELVMPSNPLILCRPLLFLSSIFPSIRVFSNESVLCIRWPNIGASASASVLPMNIQDWSPFRMDWLDLLAVQETLKSLLQHHSSEASIFSAQPSLWSNIHIHIWLLEKP